ncbi:DsbA family protein [Clostridium estertheticum]|uniref:DsbA family protein n=1 Tax=Clostridium estertheticum TaxID=238834 RepID=UPI001C0C2E3B|nr:DsbA family protein [Clostridium estertheticum]MBU3201351.1 DsbA family protein [Clostridium estertheticum]WAG66644.1 DsbA family protein [Clostridium estertheticum]
MKPKIYYVMDTMCGWCYSFSDVVTKIYEEFKDQVDFTIVPAGMWLNEDVKEMTPGFSDFIRENNVKITQLSGKEFGEDYYLMLKDSNTVLDSLPGSKAINVINNLGNQSSFSYLKTLQKEFFINGKNMNDVEVYSKIAEDFGIDGDSFKKEFSSKKLIDQTFNQFNFASELDVSSYPSLILVNNEKSSLVSSGYLSFEEVKTRIEKSIGSLN